MPEYLLDEDYQTHVLKGVSRTFALTIPQLPPGLRLVISNAYLLCRITDTIEDEPALTPAEKRLFFQEFTLAIAGNASAEELSHTLLPLLSEHTLAAEKDLIANIPRVLRITHSFSAYQQEALHRCVRIMSEGMADFQQTCSRYGVKDLAEMNHYCYCVAGVVGEMLTTLFCDYSLEIEQQQERLQTLAVSFGQGLQMTNILKDMWNDLKRGACWLPQEIFTQYGYDLKDLSPDSYDPAFGQGLQHLITITLEHLRNALNYVLLIPKRETGIRRFCLWALGMAILTLRNLHEQPDFNDGQQVKISRRSVKATILTANIATYSNTSLQVLFYWLTHTLSKPPRLSS